MFKSTVFVAMTLFVAVLANAADDPVAPAFTLSPMRIADLKAMPFLFKSLHGTYQQIGPTAAELNKTIHAKNVAATGGLVMVFKNPSPDPTAQISMDIGVPVAEGTKAPDGYEVGTLESVHSATAVFTGNAKDLSSGIMQLITQIKKSGNDMVGPIRQRFLYWEGEDSENNVVLIEIPLQSL
jgi:DNA gyrase inhibitor GyrI